MKVECVDRGGQTISCIHMGVECVDRGGQIVCSGDLVGPELCILVVNE